MESRDWNCVDLSDRMADLRPRSDSVLNILTQRGGDSPQLSRRTLMQVGAIGALGLSDLLRGEAFAKPADRVASSFGRAKRVLLLYLQGAASQFETWDPKPDAPAEIRGEFGAVSTSVTGTHICDRLPKLATLVDRMAIIRSMTHPYNNHSNHYTLTGYPTVDFASETNPRDPRHHPFFLSVLDYLRANGIVSWGAEEGDRFEASHELPGNIGLPQRFSKHSLVQRAGPYGAFLGDGFNPVWTEFQGEATQSIERVSFFAGGKDVTVTDPYLGIRPQDRLSIANELRSAADVDTARIDQRLRLLEQLESTSRRGRAAREFESIDRFNEMARSLMTSDKVASALDIGQEPDDVRDAYGMNLFGQSVLTARRLLEEGCRLVSVFWDEHKVVNTAWDTHFNHFTRLGNELLPGLDQALSTLIVELEDRGMLEDTLVMCLTEHGRTPKINNLNRGGGRDHWSDAYSVMLCGGGIREGIVVGATDERGAFVHDRPVTPEDVLATMYHLMGVNADITIPDQLQRPIWLTRNGSKIQELIQ